MQPRRVPARNSCTARTMEPRSRPTPADRRSEDGGQNWMDSGSRERRKTADACSWDTEAHPQAACERSARAGRSSRTLPPVNPDLPPGCASSPLLSVERRFHLLDMLTRPRVFNVSDTHERSPSRDNPERRSPRCRARIPKEADASFARGSFAWRRLPAPTQSTSCRPLRCRRVRATASLRPRRGV